MGGTVSVADLITELSQLGIKLEVQGDRLRYSPRSAMTPELAERVKSHKAVLLAILTSEDMPAALLWHMALDRLEAGGEFAPEHLEGCRRASTRWEKSPSLPGGSSPKDTGQINQHPYNQQDGTEKDSNLERPSATGDR